MNQVTIQDEALRHNLERVDALLDAHGASLTVVAKALCGHEPTIAALHRLGARSLADSRLPNLEAVRRAAPGAERWYLRPPHPSEIDRVVRVANVSLNSEIRTIRLLDRAAGRAGLRHGVVIMVELGDLREGLLPGALVSTYEDALRLDNIDVLGIGANLGCLSGVVPSRESLMQLAMYHELLELKFGRRLPIVSAGTSAVLPLLMEGQLPAAINHFRVGESILLGTDLVNGGTLEGFRDDGALVDAEIIEIKEKSMAPTGEVAHVSPFESAGETVEHPPGGRGYRALVNIGQVDTEVSGLIPVDPRHRIAGASSDITVVHIGEDAHGLQVGDRLRFRMGYASFVRLMSSRYTDTRLASADRDDVVLSPILCPIDGDGTVLGA